MPSAQPLHLFEGYGVELEYMLVDTATLDIRPVCDKLFEKVIGQIVSEHSFGRIAWSNELALHVIELKTDGPAPAFDGLEELFQEHVSTINREAADSGWRLMPTAMHPWMDPEREMKLWPHEYNAVYEAYNRIFDCRGHGWSNLQSVHLNLPFANDDEFGRLHAAIRLALPLLPAIAASSPIYGGKPSGMIDSRMEFYRTNSAKVPSLTAGIVPEQVYSQADYQSVIMERLYRDIAPWDDTGALRGEFLNSRGAIARFDRGSIEIRILDVQECPRADIAVCAVVSELLKQIVNERWSRFESQKLADTTALQEIMNATIRRGGAVVIDNPHFLSLFGFTASSMGVAELWSRILDDLQKTSTSVARFSEQGDVVDIIRNQGNLSERILKAVGSNPDHQTLKSVYSRLCDCLDQGQLFQ